MDKAATGKALAPVSSSDLGLCAILPAILVLFVNRFFILLIEWMMSIFSFLKQECSQQGE